MALDTLLKSKEFILNDTNLMAVQVSGLIYMLFRVMSSYVTHVNASTKRRVGTTAI